MGKEGREEEEPSMHDQTSASHWSARLAFSDRRLWPKTTEGGRGGEEGKMMGWLEKSQLRADAMTAASGLEPWKQVERRRWLITTRGR